MESEVGPGDGLGPDRLPEPAVGQVSVVIIGGDGSGGAGSVFAAGAAASAVGGEGVAAVLAAAAPGLVGGHGAVPVAASLGVRFGQAEGVRVGELLGSLVPPGGWSGRGKEEVVAPEFLGADVV